MQVEKWNNFHHLPLLEVMQELMDMDLSVLKACDSSSTAMMMQYFEVVDSKGKKVASDKSMANITKALSLLVMDQTERISDTPEISRNENAILRMHVVEFVAEWGAGLLGVLSRLLVATNFRVHSAGCYTRKGRVECVIYVKGARTGTLLWELRHNAEYFPISHERFKAVVHRVATEEFS